MKRFILDGILIFILVVIGSSIMKTDPLSPMEKQITQFEQDVANHKIIFPQVEGISVHPIHMNKASKLAKTSSEMIEKSMRFTLETLASVFEAIVE